MLILLIGLTALLGISAGGWVRTTIGNAMFEYACRQPTISELQHHGTYLAFDTNDTIRHTCLSRGKIKAVFFFSRLPLGNLLMNP